MKQLTLSKCMYTVGIQVALGMMAMQLLEFKIKMVLLAIHLQGVILMTEKQRKRLGDLLQLEKIFLNSGGKILKGMRSVPKEPLKFSQSLLTNGIKRLLNTN